MHKSISQFTLTHTSATANEIIEQEHYITLSDDDWKRFFEVIENSPEPHQKLHKTAKRFQSEVSQ